ncbi:MAG: ATP-binding protein [Planctomycetota bacterium]
MSEVGAHRREELRLEVPRDTYYLATIRAAVRAAATRAGFDAEDAHRIQTAVDEACAVAISDAAARASGERPALRERAQLLVVQVRYDRRKLSATVCDQGGHVDFGASLGGGEVGGPTDMPFLLISGFMDEVEFGEGEDGPEITLVKWRRRPGASSRLGRVDS